MKPYARSQRVGSQIKKILSDLLQKQIHDPRLAAVTITGVKMTADLRIAKIYFSTHRGKENVARANEGFVSARGFVKRILAQELGLRYMPELTFYYDESFDYAAHIEKLIKSIHTDHGTDRQPT